MVYGTEVRLRELEGIGDWHELDHHNGEVEACDHQSSMCDECEDSWAADHEVRLSCEDESTGELSVVEYV